MSWKGCVKKLDAAFTFIESDSLGILQVVFLSELSMGDQAMAALLSILSSNETIVDQPSTVDQIEQIIVPSEAARILAEIKTR